MRALHLLGLFLCLSVAYGAAADELRPAHGRPFFMPEWRRQEILVLIAEAEWARREYADVKRQADNGNMFWAAFVYALEGDSRYAEVAGRALRSAVGGGGPGWWREFNEQTNWEGGMPWMSPVWYGLNVNPYVVYDWIYGAIDDDVREDIRQGLRLKAKTRMKSLETWSYTPNLVFKPMFMIAFAGLALQDDDILEWGFERGGRQGHFYSLMNRMLLDGGPWHEAPIYAIAHQDLWCMATMALYRNLYDGNDWFSATTPNGGSPRGLMDYYINTAYPIENTGVEAGRIRIATHGHGSTTVDGAGRMKNLFLTSPTPQDGLIAHDELVRSFAVSGDRRYAPFIAMIPDYQPNLWDRRPLPDGDMPFPEAPSSVWPTFGLAMLRSDESSGYWTNPEAIAVFHIMTRGYGHAQQDRFHINLFGANRLLYPDFLAFQYENYALAWTTSTVSKNTMMVDEEDSGAAVPDVRHAFTPDVKYLATSADGVFEGVEQTRALMLTGEYLLDLFHASSKTPRLYDYNLRSFGLPNPISEHDYEPTAGLSRRYWPIEDQRKTTTSDMWQFEFVMNEERDSRLNPDLGDIWYDHEARVRVTMAAAPDTVFCYGTWGRRKFLEGAAETYGERATGRRDYPDMGIRLGMLTARRENTRETVFVATHEPTANAAVPQVRKVAVVASTRDAMVVRVEAHDFIDYAAIAWGRDAEAPLHNLAADGDRHQVFSFRDYGYLRINRDGSAVARGGWEGLRIRESEDLRLIRNGAPWATEVENGYVNVGVIPDDADIHFAPPAPEPPFGVGLTPAVARVSRPGRTHVSMAVTNTLDMPVSGSLEFVLPDNVSIAPARPEFGVIAPGETATVQFTLAAEDTAPQGLHNIPVRFNYRPVGTERSISTAHIPLPAIIGRVFRTDRMLDEPMYVAETPTYSARMIMAHGLPRYLEDPDGNVRLDGVLFTYTCEDGIPVLSEQPSGGYVWGGLRMTGQGSHRQDGVFRSSRYTLNFGEDRITAGIVRTWTNFREAHITVHDHWVSPGGRPVWRHIIGLDADGREVAVDEGYDGQIVAAELEFPGAEWHLAFAFSPANHVLFEGAGMAFGIDVSANETWSLGFIRPDGLDEWRRY